MDNNEILYREISLMVANGWTVQARWENGADFVSDTKSSISVGVHILLVLITFGIWLPIMLIMEFLNSSNGLKRCRLTVEQGVPRYQNLQ